MDLSTRKCDISPRPLCLPKLKSITVLLYAFSFKNNNFATFITFVVKDMFNLQSKTSI